MTPWCYHRPRGSPRRRGAAAVRDGARLGRRGADGPGRLRRGARSALARPRPPLVGVGRNGNGNGGNGHAAAPIPPAGPGLDPADRAAARRGPAEASVAIPVSGPAAAIPIRPVEPGDEPPAPSDAVPVRAIASEGEVPPRGHGTISIGFAGEVELEQLLPAIESLTAAIRGRPGSLPVVINIPVAGATRQVRLPLHAEWDDGLGELLARAAGTAAGGDAAGRGRRALGRLVSCRP